MAGQALDGRSIAAALRAEVKVAAGAFANEAGRMPGLDVVLVGDDPASAMYTRSKAKAANEVGIAGRLHALPATTTEGALLALIDELNGDDAVDGILVQLPLPPFIASHRVLDAVRPDKDVDGFHPVNAGLLASGRPALAPCTPRGIMRLLREAGVETRGANAVVIGRSNIVGKPTAQLLTAADATVTLAHSRTRDLAEICRRADVVVAAVGRAELVRGDFIKPGATVIDVGTNRSPSGKLVGDVAYDEAIARAAWVTPVPGGVGPMTIACLLENTVTAARRRRGDAP